jgi:hypothetical protein
MDKYLPLEDLTIKKNGEIVTPIELLPSLYDSFIKYE